MSCPTCGKDHEYSPPQSFDDVSMESIMHEVELGHMPMIEFVPTRSCHVGYNFVKIWVVEGVVNKVPKCFYDVYMNSEMASRQAFVNAEGSLASRGFQSEVTTGWRGDAT